MKKILTLSLLTLVLAFAVATAGYSQETEGSEARPSESKNIGLTVGLDYYSTYLWRGTYFYGGEGAYCPSIGWDIFDIGLSIGVGGEFAIDYLFEKTGRDSTGFDLQSVDFGIDYSYTIADLVTLGAGLWYWYYFNSEDALGADASFLTATVSIGFEVLLSPFIAVTYDYYVDKNFCEDRENEKDFYIQAGIGHDFELTPEVTVSLGLAAGYYHARSIKACGISDIDASMGLSVTKGIVTISGGFHYVAVPTDDFYAGSDIHRWYASFGASVLL